MRRAIAAALALALAGAPVLGVEAITKPSGDVKLSFVRPGLIGRVLVKEGQAVDAGAILMEQDDTAERVQMEQLKVQAEDTTKVDYAVAQRDQKNVYLKRIREAGALGTTPTEIEMAELDVKVAELSLQLARFEHRQDQRKYEEAAAQIERMRIKSPIVGKVESITLRQGEGAEALAPLIRVVSIDPLWIDVPVELTQARCLVVGSEAKVEFPPCALAGGTVSVPAGSVEGKIIHIGAVADAASSTLLVRVEVPNPSGRPAGERVEVTFTASVQAQGTTRPVQSPTTQPRSASSDNRKE